MCFLWGQEVSVVLREDPVGRDQKSKGLYLGLLGEKLGSERSQSPFVFLLCPSELSLLRSQKYFP